MNKKQKKKKGDELTCMNELLSKSARLYLLHNIRSKTNGFFFIKKRRKNKYTPTYEVNLPPPKKKIIKKRAYTQIEKKNGRMNEKYENLLLCV